MDIKRIWHSLRLVTILSGKRSRARIKNGEAKLKEIL